MNFIKIISHEEDYEILRCDLLLFAIFMTHNDTSTMNYVLKDHIGSLYATVTDGDVEYYSFDAWGHERNHNTLQYDNINTTFDRGFCMHEHYRDFGLINMNGRMYDPYTSMFLSPDNYIQAPDNSQSFNRYAYCLNNPLKYTDPNGESFIGAAVAIGAIIGAYSGGVLANDGNFNIFEWNSSTTLPSVILGGFWGGVSGWLGISMAGSGFVFSNTAAMASSSLLYSSGMYFTGNALGFDYDITMNLGVASISYSPDNKKWSYGYLFNFKDNEWYDYISYGLGFVSNITDIYRFATWGIYSNERKIEILRESIDDKDIKISYDKTISEEGLYSKTTNEIKIGKKGLRYGKGWAISTMQHEYKHHQDVLKGLGNNPNEWLDYRAYCYELQQAEANGLSPTQYADLSKRFVNCANQLENINTINIHNLPKYTIRQWLKSLYSR